MRNALAFSTITAMPFKIENIRKGRTQAGLKNQHLYCIKGLKILCNAEVKGDISGSLELFYNPSLITGKRLEINIGTAGSITLLLQSLILPCLFSSHNIKVTITGGTDVRWSMPYDYFSNIYLPYLNVFTSVRSVLKKRGYYPKGGGEVELEIEPLFRDNSYPSLDELKERLGQFQEIDLTHRGELREIKGFVHSSSDLQKNKVGERIRETALNILKTNGYKSNITIEYNDTFSSGCGIVLQATFKSPGKWPVVIGADVIGERGLTSERAGKKAAELLIKRIEGKAPVDEHLADNLLPLLALFGGRMNVERISKHTISGIYVIEKFLGNIFNINENIISVRRN